MKTDSLISALAADTVPAAGMAGQAWRALVPALGVALVAIWLTLGFRSDLAQALGNPVSLLRWVLTGALAIVSMRTLSVLVRPEGNTVVRFWPLVLVAAVALMVLIWAYVTTPAEGRQMAIVGKSMWTCLVAIPALSVLPVGALFWGVRRGATTVPSLTGAMIGLAGSGAAAAVYAIHCTEDSPLFFVTWYGVAILSVTVVSAAIGGRILRW
jgi:hypothetical protein